MQAVLYVSHGSRLPQAREEAIAFLETVSKAVDIPLQEICFLELADPDIEEGIARLAARGATHIAIIPVLLLSAGHYYKDIPDEINHIRRRYPAISFVYGQPLGVQERIINLVTERVKEAGADRHADADILLVGRGSRHPETRKSIEQVGKQLQEKIGLPVRTCYLAACSPSFEEGLQASRTSSKRQTFIVPYLWFTGLLVRSMEKKIEALQQETAVQLVLCRYLGSHPIMVQALVDRVREVLKPQSIEQSNL